MDRIGMDGSGKGDGIAGKIKRFLGRLKMLLATFLDYCRDRFRRGARRARSSGAAALRHVRKPLDMISSASQCWKRLAARLSSSRATG